jgi:hypothetical protein
VNSWKIGELTPERLSQLIRRVRQNPSYRDKARYFQKVIARTHGLDLAPDVIERAFKKKQIVDSARYPAAPSHMCDICALLGVLEEFTGFLVLCLVGRIVRREAEILPVPV